MEILNIGKGFTEDDLYDNLFWINDNQSAIENYLCKKKGKESDEELFLYDVTSTYLEGVKNELANFGYNRDKKRGKMQLVVGLLCDSEGDPISVEVFEGNTSDPTTFTPQIKKVASRFGCKSVTFVGDRGMIKANQIAELKEKGFHYVTAITKPQIKSLIREGVFQYDLFDENLVEISYEQVRYVLHRNPLRAEQIAGNREKMLGNLNIFVERQNEYLKNHSKAKTSVALAKVQAKINSSKMIWVSAKITDRVLSIEQDKEILKEAAKLDGCYVIKTDLPIENATTEIVHSRYKDLALVEWAFRSSKTVLLELRPVFVCKKENTRAHVFVVMLAYKIIRELYKCWNQFDITVEEALRSLSSLCDKKNLATLQEAA